MVLRRHEQSLSHCQTLRGDGSGELDSNFYQMLKLK